MHVYHDQTVAGVGCVLFRGGGPTHFLGEKTSTAKKYSLRKKSRSGEKTQNILPFSPATALQLSA